MAVALATLPLKSVLAGDGDTLLTTGAGAGTTLTAGLATGFAATLTGLLTGLATGFATGFAVDLTGAATFLGTGLATGFVAFLTTLPLTLLFLTATFFGAGFLAAGFLTATFFMTTFFTTAFLTAAFLAGLAFFGCGLATTFLATGLGLATDFLAATGLATGFFAAVLLTNLLTVFFAGVLALFTVRPFVAAAFGLPALATCVLAGVFPFCALAAVELRVVFAISLHRFWPWRPGVIAHVFYTSKLASGILVPLHAASRSGNVNIPTRLILWLLRLYKRWLSPLLGKRCRFYPSCSDYARIAVTRFGPWRGSLLTSWRLLRCQPLCAGGEDPVPEHFHFPRCRLPGDSNHVH